MVPWWRRWIVVERVNRATGWRRLGRLFGVWHACLIHMSRCLLYIDYDFSDLEVRRRWQREEMDWSLMALLIFLLIRSLSLAPSSLCSVSPTLI